MESKESLELQKINNDIKKNFIRPICFSDLPKIARDKIAKILSTKDIGNVEQASKNLLDMVRNEKINRFKKACFNVIMTSEVNFGETSRNGLPDSKYSLESMCIKDKTVFNLCEKVHNGPPPIKPGILLIESIEDIPADGTLFIPRSVRRIKPTIPQIQNIFFEEGSNLEKIDGDVFCEKEINGSLVRPRMKEIVFPPSLKFIGRDLFWFSHNIQRIEFEGSGVKKIPQSAFAYCQNLQEIILPKKLCIIENFAFDMCLGLREIILPETVESVEKNVFNQCRNLIIYMSRSKNLHLSSFYIWNKESFPNNFRFSFY